MEYLLSIVVPTKNRYGYLEPLVRLIEGFANSNVELVIEDNSDDNLEFLPILKKMSFPDLHYYYNDKPISVGENLDNAIAHSRGEYVCVIGDDDGVLPSIINCVEWMKENSVDAIIPMIIPYLWPDHDEVSMRRKGLLKYSPVKRDRIVEFLDPVQTLEEALKNGFLNRGMLPICYHGVVSRKALDIIYNRGGAFSPGPSPDIAAGVALSLVVKKYALIKYPIIISGASRQHGGGAYRMKYGAAEIKDVPFLPKNSFDTWERSLPKIWTVETVWPESAIKALRYMGREDLIKKVNFNRIYFEFLIRRFYYRKRLYAVIDKKILFWLYFIPNFMVLSIKYILRKITPNKLSKVELIEKDNVPTIKEVAFYIDSLYDRSINFNNGLGE